MEKQYILYKIKVQSGRDQLIASLLNSNIPGLEETDSGIEVYTGTKEEESIVEGLIKAYALASTREVVPGQNWNSLWESTFQPINVPAMDGQIFVHVRAFFHPPFNAAKHEIIITPKMSFGTGHHETTFLMMQEMELLKFSNKSVIDFGTGTGILAILADKLGAARVVGIDNDEWSITNAIENGTVNQAGRIRWQIDDNLTKEEPVDIILGNINLNIILANLMEIKAKLLPGGDALFSGLLVSDKEIITKALNEVGLEIISSPTRNSWLAIHCKN